MISATTQTQITFPVAIPREVARQARSSRPLLRYAKLGTPAQQDKQHATVARHDQHSWSPPLCASAPSLRPGADPPFKTARYLLPLPSTWQESFWLSVIGRLMETKLLQLLRFKAGDVYSVSVGGFFGAEAPSREGEMLV